MIIKLLFFGEANLAQSGWWFNPFLAVKLTTFSALEEKGL